MVLAPVVPLDDVLDLPGDGGVGAELPAPVCGVLPALPALPVPSSAQPLACTPEETP